MSRRAGSDDVKGWKLSRSGDAAGEARVTSPQCVPAPAVNGQGVLTLLDRVHRETAGPLQPNRVAGAREQLEEGEPVARRSVAEASPLREWARFPNEFTAGHQQVINRRIGEAGEAGHHTWG